MTNLPGRAKSQEPRAKPERRQQKFEHFLWDWDNIHLAVNRKPWREEAGLVSRMWLSRYSNITVGRKREGAFPDEKTDLQTTSENILSTRELSLSSK